MAQDQGTIRDALDETRQQMSDTLETLADKVDAKARVGAGVDELRDQAGAALGEVKDRAGQLAAKAADVPRSARPMVEAAGEPLRGGAGRVRSHLPLVVAVGVIALAAILTLGRRHRHGS